MKIKIKELMFLNNFTDQSKYHRPGLNGVLIEPKHIAATNGHCMGCFTGDTGVEKNMLIDVAKLLKTNPFLKKLDYITVMEEGQFVGAIENGHTPYPILGTLADYTLDAENYPDFHRVIPSKTRITNTITAFSADTIAKFSMKGHEDVAFYTTDGPAFVVKPSLHNFLGLAMPMYTKGIDINVLEYFKVEKTIMLFNIEAETQTPGRYFTKCDSEQYATHKDIKTQQFYCLMESTIVQPDKIEE